MNRNWDTMHKRARFGFHKAANGIHMRREPCYSKGVSFDHKVKVHLYELSNDERLTKQAAAKQAVLRLESIERE